MSTSIEGALSSEHQQADAGTASTNLSFRSAQARQVFVSQFLEAAHACDILSPFHNLTESQQAGDGGLLNRVANLARLWNLNQIFSKIPMPHIAAEAAAHVFGKELVAKHLHVTMQALNLYVGLDLPKKATGEEFKKFTDAIAQGHYAKTMVPLLLKPKDWEESQQKPSDAQVNALKELMNSLTISSVAHYAKIRCEVEMAKVQAAPLLPNVFMQEAVDQAKDYAKYGKIQTVSATVDIGDDVPTLAMPSCLFDVVFVVQLPVAEFERLMIKPAVTIMGILSVYKAGEFVSVVMSALGCFLGAQLQIMENFLPTLVVADPLVELPSSDLIQVKFQCPPPQAASKSS